MTSHALNRRRMLTLGVTGAASLGVAACARAEEAPQAAAATGPAPTLTAQATEGPYYFDPKLERTDITEGHAGVPLDVRFTVADAAGAAIAGARVDIWHCNAAGLYSGYAGQGDDRQTATEGETFLRGYASTDASGAVTFNTIYPGWYRGRTTHIHFKVAVGDRTVLTSQFFLPDALSEFLYANLPDYRRAAVRDTLNATDGIALQAGETVLGNVREMGDRYVATLALAVNRDAGPVADRGLGGGRPPSERGERPQGPPREGGGAGASATLTGEARIDALVPGDQS